MIAPAAQIMNELIAIETYRDFKIAAKSAKELAVQLHQSTAVRRSEGGWDVLVPRAVANEFLDESEDHSDYGYYSDHDPQDDDVYEERGLIGHELSDYSDSMALSEEDGWFYDD